MNKSTLQHYFQHVETTGHQRAGRLTSLLLIAVLAYLLSLVSTQMDAIGMKPNHTQEDIISGIVSQNRDILTYCYQQYSPMVTNWILNRGGTREEAKDLFQDGMIALYSNLRLNKFEQGRAKISTYLLQICKFKYLDMKKSSRYKHEISVGEDYNEDIVDHSDSLDILNEQKVIHSALKKLKEQCRTILQYYYWENRTMEEIATEMNMQVNSVKNGKYRCMQSLKEIYKTERA